MIITFDYLRIYKKKKQLDTTAFYKYIQRNYQKNNSSVTAAFV